jgi:hypothetical protein
VSRDFPLRDSGHRNRRPRVPPQDARATESRWRGLGFVPRRHRGCADSGWHSTRNREVQRCTHAREPLPPAPPHPDEPASTALVTSVSQGEGEACKEPDSDPSREKRQKRGESQPVCPGENDRGRLGEDPQPSFPYTAMTAHDPPNPLAHPLRPDQEPEAQPPTERPLPNADEPTPESADSEI